MRKKIFCRMCKPELAIYAEFEIKFIWDGKDRHESLCNTHTQQRVTALKKSYGLICEVRQQQQPLPMLWS